MDYIALITYVFVMSVTPGPNNIMVTASGANYGYRATVPHMLGISIGSTLIGALSCLGLGAVFTEFPLLHTALSWVGLVYMLYLSAKLLGVRKIKNEKPVRKPLTFTQAAMFQILNPKVWIVAVTLASIFMPKNGEVLFPTFIIWLVCFVSTVISVNIWTVFGSAMKRFLKTEKNQFIFNLVMALLLVATAIMIVSK